MFKNMSKPSKSTLAIFGVCFIMILIAKTLTRHQS